MNRRDFTQHLAAGSLVGAACASPALANIKEDGSNKFPSFAQIELTVGRQVFIPLKLIIIADDFSAEIGIDSKLPVFNEDRASLLKPTLKKTFRGGVKVGTVGLHRRSLVVYADVPNPPTTISINDNEVSFRVDFKSAKKHQGGVPTLGSIPLIGSLFRQKRDTEFKRNLMIIMNPKVLNYVE